MIEEKKVAVPVSGPVPSIQERQLPEFNAMQKVKRRFFAMRNGDLAQQMAERGAKYRINFGLNLPQISEIARDFLPGGREREGLSPDFDMADFSRRLRDNTTTRESMLIAPMLFPVDSLTMEEALAWACSVPTPEVADILCLKLLRNFHAARELAEALLSEPTPMSHYTALRLLLNLVQTGKISPSAAISLMTVEESCPTPLTATLLRQLRDEIDFLAES